MGRIASILLVAICTCIALPDGARPSAAFILGKHRRVMIVGRRAVSPSPLPCSGQAP